MHQPEQNTEKAVRRPKPRLILHAGTPKTGTSTLQVCFHQCRRTLSEQGILYPAAGIEPSASPPKHQWIADALLANDERRFKEQMDQVLSEMADYLNVHTVLLSTEGIYNHWWDYSDAAKMLLKELQRDFEVSVWTVFRNPLSFARSYYGQVVKNPKFSYCPCYGTSEPLEVVIDDLSFSRTLRYADFIKSIETLFEKPVVIAGKYEDGDTIHQAVRLLKIDAERIQPVARTNQSLGATGIALVRRLNRMDIDREKRARYIGLIAEISAVLDHDADNMNLSAEVRDKVDVLAGDSRTYLKDRYHIAW